MAETPDARGPAGRTPGGRPSARLRILWVLLLLGGLYATGHATGILDRVDPDSIRATVASAGLWGVLLYILLFAAGELIQIPGAVFVGAAALAWGGVAGYAAALTASIASVCIGFVVVRSVGGRAIAAIERPFVRRMLARLDRRPVTTVVVLRSILWVSPPLTYALAMTNLRFRDHLLGSALGLVLPVLAMTFLFDLLL